MKTDAGQEVFRTGLAAGAGSLRLSYDDDAMTVGRVEVLGEALGTLAGPISRGSRPTVPASPRGR